MINYQQQGRFLDKIQIRYGLILDVIKYDYIYGSLSSMDYDKKKDMKRVEKGIYQSTRDIHDSWYNITHPAGTYFIGYRPIELVEPKDYRYEIRVSGGVIAGDLQSILNYIEDIKHHIINYGGSQND